MKIYGSHLSKVNSYQQQMHKQTNDRQPKAQQDQLQISNEAKRLLKSEQTTGTENRQAYVQNIKDAVARGDYQIDYAKTARKMIDVWSGES